MLSKYNYWKKESCSGTAGSVSPAAELASALRRSLKQRHSDVTMPELLPGGTLGVLFRLFVDGRKKFAKTHQPGEIYRENLVKEIKVMSLICEDRGEIENGKNRTNGENRKKQIELEEVRILANGIWYVFLVMDELFPCAVPLPPQKIRACIQDYGQKLCQSGMNVSYSFTQILEAGKESLDILEAEGFLTRDCYCRCAESLERMEAYSWKEHQIICHGDLSNVNVMQNAEGQLVVIDWEDALLAFEEYDFLYWLTFFSQRNYYTQELLRSCGIGLEWGTDLMVLITIIKSRMSYWNGSYVKNQISYQDRIYEIYKIKEESFGDAKTLQRKELESAGYEN